MSAAAPAVELPRAMRMENAVETAIREYAEANPKGAIVNGVWWSDISKLALHITKALPDVRTQMLREVIADRAIEFAVAHQAWQMAWDHARTIDLPMLLDNDAEMSRLSALTHEHNTSTRGLIEVVDEYQKGGAT